MNTALSAQQQLMGHTAADTLRRYSLPVAMVVAVIALPLFLFGYAGIAQYFMLGAGCILIYGGNFAVAERHRQWALPFLAIVITLLMAGGVAWARGEYLAFLQYFDSWIQPIENLLKVSFPRDIIGALPFFNILLLLFWGIFKLAVANAIRVREKLPFRVVPKRQDVAAISGAYAYRPQRGWFLQPQWHFVRHFSVALTLLSIVALIISWQVFAGTASSDWVPILPAAALVIFGELAAYLGGLHYDSGGIRFGGEDVISSPWGNYEKVWRDMRQVWPRQWLAAGNRALWGKRQ